MNKLEKIDQAIRNYYEGSVSTDLVESVLYSVDAGGKRIRPLFMLDILEGFGLELEDAHFAVAGALEMIHTGSLIHDDLPAMDNDDYRRGRLTNHKKFDEATAILAGDSLFLDAFGLVASSGLKSSIALELVRLLSIASGHLGMVGGQMLDMKGEGQQLELKDLTLIHHNKTGQLLAYPFAAAGLIAQKSSEVVAELQDAGWLIGYAFQVRDDILDVTATFEELGKTPQKDLVAEKSTFPGLLGLEQSRVVLNDSLDKALAIFKELEESEGFDATSIREKVEGLRLNG